MYRYQSRDVLNLACSFYDFYWQAEKTYPNVSVEDNLQEEAHQIMSGCYSAVIKNLKELQTNTSFCSHSLLDSMYLSPVWAPCLSKCCWQLCNFSRLFLDFVSKHVLPSSSVHLFLDSLSSCHRLCGPISLSSALTIALSMLYACSLLDFISLLYMLLAYSNFPADLMSLPTFCWISHACFLPCT